MQKKIFYFGSFLVRLYSNFKFCKFVCSAIKVINYKQEQTPVLQNNSKTKICLSFLKCKNASKQNCVKSIRIRSYFSPYFPAFRRNTERFSVSLYLRIQSECGKIRTRITLYTDTFYAV